MGRVIVKIGPEPPVVENAVQTFDTNFDEADALKSGRFGPDGYTWLYSAKDVDRGVPDTVETVLRAKDGTYQPVYIEPHGLGNQVTINGEILYFVRLQEILDYNLPDLTFVKDGKMHQRAVRTPDNFKDVAKTTKDVDTYGDFAILSVNRANNTIRVRGNIYEVNRHSDDGRYLFGVKRMGLSRFHRDDLNSDPAGAPSWQESKLRKYDYAWLRVQPPGLAQTLVKYNRIEDPSNDDWVFAEVDLPLTDPSAVQVLKRGKVYRAQAPAGVPEAGQVMAVEIKEEHNTVQTMTAAYWDQYLKPLNGAAITPSEHVIHLEPDQLTDQQWTELEAAGSQVKLYRRLPWISHMKTTGGQFAQLGGLWEMELQISNDKFQFGATWLWAVALQLFVGASSRFPTYDFDDRYTNATELDCWEWPGGGHPLNKHHNMHASGIGGMEDYARLNGIEPLLPENSEQLMQGRPNIEWDTDVQAGHAMNIGPGEPGFIDYSRPWKLRVYHWLDGAAYGKPDNSVEWYAKQSDDDGPFRRIAGSIAPPWWKENPGAPKQVFFNLTMGGNFVNFSQNIYTRGLESTTQGQFSEVIYSYLRCFQFPGHEAGFSGYPDEDGVYRRKVPTPDDRTGNSGMGIVGASDPPGMPAVNITALGTTTDPLPPVVTGPIDTDNAQLVENYDEVGLTENGGRLLVPDITD